MQIPVYALQCPLCSAVDQAPFVRTGAVVRCAHCSAKFRIKSSQVTRNLTTGPRTLDEMDPLLSGDSVDLDPDTEAAPVTIDESGQVVGLSGLTELMRQGDAKLAKADAKARSKAAEAPPAGRVTRAASAKPPAAPRASAKPEPAKTSKTAKPAAPAATPASPQDSATAARERAQQRARQRKLHTNLMIAAGGLTLVLLVVALFVVFGGSNPPAPTDPNTPQAAGTNPADPATVSNNPDPGPIELFPDNNPDDNRPPDPQPPSPGPRDPSLFGSGNNYSPNPDPKYTAASPLANPPAEVPAVLIQPEPLTHEGWYILTPPRGAIDASGPAGEVELSKLTKAYTTPDGQAILTATLANRGNQAAIAGEAHLALLDPAGRVFAETYLPFALLGPGESREVRIDIDQRFWDRCRDTRAHAVVKEAEPALATLNNVRLAPLGKGPSTAVRVSVRNPRDTWLGDVVLILTATDLDDHPVASYRVTQQDLLIPPGQWLDMVIHTPLPNTANTVYQWKATLHVPAGE